MLRHKVKPLMVEPHLPNQSQLHHHLSSNEANMSLHHQSEAKQYTSKSYPQKLLSICFGLVLVTLFMTACGMLLDDPALYPDMEVAGEESNEQTSNLDSQE